MPATTTTVEKFPLTPPPPTAVERERDLRIKAGAIRSTISKDAQNWILTTEWNVIGENDP